MVISSCGKVTIQDNEWCGDIGNYGATCSTMLSNKVRELDKVSWDEERFGMICGKPEAFADLKQAIQKLCYKNKKCQYEQLEKITRFIKEIENEVASYEDPKVSTQE